MVIHADCRTATVEVSGLPTADEAAAILKIQPAPLATWRVRGHPHLPLVGVGRCIRYRRQDIAAFIDGHLADRTGAGRP
jgi:hypothetical protein